MRETTYIGLFDYKILFRLPATESKPVCTVRATAITFILVVLIVIAAAIAVGIVFGTIRTSQNTNTAGMLPGYTGQSTCLCIFILY
jgi:hypothetical protein